MMWFNFILGLNVLFPCLCCMAMYDYEFETEENKIETKDEIETPHVHLCCS